MSQTRFRVILPGPIHNQFTKAREILTYFQSRTITRRNSTKQKRKIWFVNNFIMVVWTGMEQSRGYLHSEYRPLCRAFHQPINMRTCYQLHIRPQICVCSRAHRLTDIVAVGTDCVLHILAVVYEKLAKTFIMSTIWARLLDTKPH